MKCEACGHIWQGTESECPKCGASALEMSGDELYSRGIAAEREGKYKAASQLYTDAADLGVPCAAYAVSRALEESGERQNNPDLYEFWLFTAAKKDPIATLAYSDYLYRLGDIRTAFRYLHNAADMGHTGAMVRLGTYYMKRGNRPAARYYFSRAKGSFRAKFFLFFLGRRKPTCAPTPPEMPDSSVESYTLGMYALKIGVKHIAYAYFEEAANQSYLPALEKAAEMCMRGEGCRRDEEKVQKYLTELGDAGKTEAYVQLGDYFVSGALGGVPNPVAAYDCYLRAAKRGNPAACVAVGDRLVDGDGVEKNLVEGLRWYDKAASLGSEVGIARAREVRAESEKLVRDGAKALAEGDFDTAFGAYHAAAERGHIGAVTALGDMYLGGRGVKAAPKKAAELYAAAASRGDNAAKYRLANLYLLNHGVRFDADRARALLTEALTAGYTPAATKLEELKARERAYLTNRLYTVSCVMYHRGDHAGAAELRARAAQLGHAKATFYLACMLDCGDGIPADRERSDKLYRRAAALGFDGRARGYLSKYLHRLPR